MFDGKPKPEAAREKTTNRIAGVVAKLDLAAHLRPNLHPVPLRDLKNKNIGQARLLDAKALETSLRDAIERALAEHKDEMRRLRALEVRHHEELAAERQRAAEVLAAATEEATLLASALERSKADLAQARAEALAYRTEARTAEEEIQRLRGELEAKIRETARLSRDRDQARERAGDAEDARDRLHDALVHDETRDLPARRSARDAATEVLPALAAPAGKAPEPCLSRFADPSIEITETIALSRPAASPAPDAAEGAPLLAAPPEPTEVNRAVPSPSPALPASSYEALDLASSPEAALLAEAFAFAATDAPLAAPEAAPPPEIEFHETVGATDIHPAIAAPASAVAAAPSTPAPASEPATAQATATARTIVREASAPSEISLDALTFESAEEEEMLLAVLEDYVSETDASPDDTQITPAGGDALAEETSSAVDRILQAAFEMPADLLEPTETMPVPEALARAGEPATALEAPVAEAPALEAPALEAAGPAPAASAVEAPAPATTEVALPSNDATTAPAWAMPETLAPAPLIVGKVTTAEVTTQTPIDVPLPSTAPTAAAAPAPAPAPEPLATAAPPHAAPAAIEPETLATEARSDTPAIEAPAAAPEAPAPLATAPEAPAVLATAPEAPAPLATATVEPASEATSPAAPAPAPVPVRLGSPRAKLPAGVAPKAAFFGFGGSGGGFGASSWKRPESGKGKRG